MASQLQQIVELLNQAPFELGLSLVVFDERDPGELLEILRRVLEHLDPKLFSSEAGFGSGPLQPLQAPVGGSPGGANPASNVSEDNPEIWCQKISEFLHIIGFTQGHLGALDHEQCHFLMCGEKRTVHGILYWLLTNLEMLKKRAFLSKFCVNLDIPEDYLRDTVVLDLFQDYKSLQSQFKSTHQHLESMRGSKNSPADLQREVAQLASEAEQLTQKISQFRVRSQNTPGFGQLLSVTSMLRKVRHRSGFGTRE